MVSSKALDSFCNKNQTLGLEIFSYHMLTHVLNCSNISVVLICLARLLAPVLR
jgi:hypothetical protein